MLQDNTFVVCLMVSGYVPTQIPICIIHVNTFSSIFDIMVEICYVKQLMLLRARLFKINN